MTTALKGVLEKSGAFLISHRLEATPTNYTFAYLYVTGSDKNVVAKANAIIDDGVRISQDEVSDILGILAGTSAPAQKNRDEIDAEQMVRHQLLKFADMASDVQKDTNQFGTDLEDGVRQMSQSGDIDMVLGMATKMVEKTRATEAKLAATQAEVKALRDKLQNAETAARTDKLTALPNRRVIEEEILKAEKSGEIYSIAFCDIDKFKSVNDRFGHAVGDRVIVSISSEIAAIAAPHMTARWGGEEFIVLFLGKDVDDAHDIMEKARQTVENKIYKVRETDEPLGRVTFSTGIASTKGPQGDVVQRADTLLYQAKTLGRNRIEI